MPTYEQRANEQGKRFVQVVELYLDFCTRSYGVAPCTAAIGVTGTDRCYNTRGSCQDAANYAKTTRVYRFATQRVSNLQAAGDPPTFPTLIGVKTSPAILTPGKGLGVRSNVSVTVQDHPWTDIGCDPYRSLRSYDPDGRGTFWGKFITRNKFYENRRMDVLSGWLSGDTDEIDLSALQRRSYIITRMSGPTPDGKVTIEGKDPLKLADGEKAKLPKASTATLTGTITAVASSIQITDPDLMFTDWWNDGQRYFKIEDEIVRANSVTSGLGTGTITLSCSRATMPAIYQAAQNVADAHDIDSTAQPAYFYDDKMVYDIVYHLLSVVAGLDAAYLPYADWQAAIDDGFSELRFSALIVEPTDVKTLLQEISELGVLLFWHERDNEVKLQPLRFLALLGSQFNDDTNILADTLRASEDVGALATQSWCYYSLSWPLANMRQLKSYRDVDVSADLDKEGADEYQRPAIRAIYSRWMDRTKRSVARRINELTIRQYREVRKIITWDMDPKDDTFWVGDTIGVATKFVQDESGLPQARNYLVTQAEEVPTQAGLRLRYVAAEQFAFNRVGVITHPQGPPGTPDPTPAPADYSSATSAEKNHWAYIGPNTGLFPDGTILYQII